MTEPINLTQLREFANRFDQGFLPSQVGRDDIEMLCDSLPALIDIAEAAHEYQRTGWTHVETPAQRRLREALARTTTNP